MSKVQSWNTRQRIGTSQKRSAGAANNEILTNPGYGFLRGSAVNGFFPRTVREWDDLPQDIADSRSFDTFAMKVSNRQ